MVCGDELHERGKVGGHLPLDNASGHQSQATRQGRFRELREATS
jgi:hypothetical protein